MIYDTHVSCMSIYENDIPDVKLMLLLLEQDLNTLQSPPGLFPCDQSLKYSQLKSINGCN